MMSASLLTSVGTANPLISFATISAPSLSRSATTTPRAPSAAKRRQRAHPMPLAPPVTTTTLSWIFIFHAFERLSSYFLARRDRRYRFRRRDFRRRILIGRLAHPAL